MDGQPWRQRLATVAGHLLGRLAGELKAGSPQVLLKAPEMRGACSEAAQFASARRPPWTPSWAGRQCCHNPRAVNT